MIRDLAIYGAGGLGREMLLLVQQINVVMEQWKVVGFIDDYKQDEVIDSVPLLGNVSEIRVVNGRLSVLVGIANSRARRNIVTQMRDVNLEYPVFIHPSSQRGSHTNQFGRGTILTAGAILTTGIHLGEFVIINLQSTIGHDVHIGNFTSIMPAVNISGNVTIGEEVLIGAGATILQGLSIGDRAIIGAGAVVTRSIPADTTVVGVPARKMIK